MDVYPVIFPAMASALGFFDTCLFPYLYLRGSSKHRTRIFQAHEPEEFMTMFGLREPSVVKLKRGFLTPPP
jgi:hypothetical protein